MWTLQFGISIRKTCSTWGWSIEVETCSAWYNDNNCCVDSQIGTRKLAQLVEWKFAEKIEVVRGNLPQCHIFYLKSHINRPDIEPGFLRWECGNSLNYPTVYNIFCYKTWRWIISTVWNNSVKKIIQKLKNHKVSPVCSLLQPPVTSFPLQVHLLFLGAGIAESV
jgi:hypothetical protein